jgi:hypothetical protein
LNDAENNDHLDIENMEVFIDNMSNSKRKRGVGVWIRQVRNFRIISRHHGKSYVTSTGQIKKERSLKPLENCCAACNKNFPEIIRVIIFREYWTLSTRDRGVQFVSALVEKKKTSVTRKRKL